MSTSAAKVVRATTTAGPTAQRAARSAAAPLADQRPATVAQRKLQEDIRNSPRAQQAATPAPVQKQANKTGLPDHLKAGVENLSGHSLDDVQVHYNSAKPAQLNAHAYAQGADIHVAPGQEQHLPHEAWHVAQQKQGRVKPTMQMKGKVNINDDVGLEKEADVMGALALAAPPVEPLAAPAQLLAGTTGVGTVQRDIDNAKYNESNAGNKLAARQLFETVNTKAKQAFEYATSVPTLGALANLNGYTRLWVTKWAEFVGGGAPKLMAATFGYVVESLVSEANSPYFPAAPGGYRLLFQVPVGGTRPDIVLAAAGSSVHVAWVDLTASNSVDHIFAKDGWDAKVPMYAEISYPSLDPGYMSLMYQNKDNTGAIDSEVFKARVEEAKKAYARKKAEWIELGESYTFSALRGEIGASREAIGLNPGLAREFIRQKLMRDFNVAGLEEKMVPSILAAMKVLSGPWGYTLGYAQSEKAGEAWLTDNDSALVPEPTVDMEESEDTDSD